MKDKIKKIVIMAVLIGLGFLLQTSVFPFLSIFGTVPNIILMLVVSVALMNGRVPAMIVGFICGLLLDILYGDYLGVYALLYMLFGYANGYFHVLFFSQESFLPLILVFVNDIIYHFIMYFIFFLPQGKWDILFYLRRIILPELVYTTVLSLVMYQLFLEIYQLTQRKKKKRR